MTDDFINRFLNGSVHCITSFDTLIWSIKNTAFHTNEIIEWDNSHGRSYIARQLCEAWQWRQPNGNFKEYAARDLLLRLEENDFILLPARKRPKNNSKIKSFDQIPLFLQKPLEGMVGDYSRPVLRELRGAETNLWDFLIHHYHYLGLPTLVGEHLLIVPVLKAHATGLQTGFTWVKLPAAPKRAMSIVNTVSQSRFTCIRCIGISGGFFAMTRDEAIALLELPQELAIEAILKLTEKAEKI